jgi:hypothetical protein
MIKEHLDLFIVAVVTISMLLYDMVFDLLYNILHMLFEGLHFVYEGFELTLEHTVEHLFHTTRHGSQIITFYILVFIACGLSYWLWKALPRLYKRCALFFQQSWIRRKAECEAYWLSLTPRDKLGLLSTTTGIICMTYLFAL